MEEIKLHQFAEKLDLLGYSPRTIHTYSADVKRFFTWLNESEGLTLDQVTPRHLGAWHAHLQYVKSAKGTYLCATTLHHRLFALKTFYMIMYREKLVRHDYAHHITPPKMKRGLPRNVPGESDMAMLLDAITPVSLLTIRDRAMLELLYATGIRNMELRCLKLEDVNMAEATLFVHGKGAKDRVVPVGAWVMPYLMEYLTAVRPMLTRNRKTDILFVTKTGRQIPSENLCYTVRKYAHAAGLHTHINPHAMRHACATHMLRGGADIRYIQELLGHAQLSTTQIYTHVDIKDLKKAHRQFHPRERMGENLQQ